MSESPGRKPMGVLHSYRVRQTQDLKGMVSLLVQAGTLPGCGKVRSALPSHRLLALGVLASKKEGAAVRAWRRVSSGDASGRAMEPPTWASPFATSSPAPCNLHYLLSNSAS